VVSVNVAHLSDEEFRQIKKAHLEHGVLVFRDQQVYGFMRQGGGALEIDSAPGSGTRVHLRFARPAASAQQPVATLPISSSAVV
jgi:alpha-ketoglutarate-dependent taurine dioxygenase